MVKERSYVYAIVFRTKSTDALGQVERCIKEKINDAWIVYKHGPSTKHLFVIAGANPRRGEIVNAGE